MTPDRQPCFLEFVYTPLFERTREKILTERELMGLEETLLRCPRAGKIERGLAGVRKIRLPIRGTGKRGGVRVLYHYDARLSRIYLLTAFPKSEQPVLTAAQRKTVRQLIAQLDEG